MIDHTIMMHTSITDPKRIALKEEVKPETRM